MSQSKLSNVEREISGDIRVLSQNGYDVNVKLMLLNEKKNRNRWIYRNLEEHLHLFRGTPILIAYENGKLGGGHNFDQKLNPDGTISQSFMSATAERIVGVIQEDAYVGIEKIDGVDWVVANAVIFGWYAPELAERLKGTGTLSDSEKRERAMRVSIETLIDDGFVEDDGTEVFEKYRILGTTILSDDTLEAVAGANIRALSAIGIDELREMTRLRVASAQEQSRKAFQQKNQEKEKKKMVTSKELQKVLPGYNVLAVNETSAVIKSSENHDFYVCSVKSENGEIIVGAKNAVDSVCFVGDGGNVEVDIAKMVGDTEARCEKAESELNAEREARVCAENKLKEMKTRETARRCEAVKKAIDARLDEINANNANKIDASVVADLKTDEAIAKYASMEDDNGNFIGETSAKKDVDHRCMSRRIEQEAEKANASKSRYAWDFNNESGKVTESGVLAAARRVENATY